MAMSRDGRCAAVTLGALFSIFDKDGYVYHALASWILRGLTLGCCCAQKVGCCGWSSVVPLCALSDASLLCEIFTSEPVGGTWM